MSTQAHLTTPTLWKNPRFVRLWLARLLSGLGSRVTSTAVPLIAAISLHATPGQMAMLVVAGQLPDLLFGLLSGAWVDRGRPGALLVVTDVGRAILLATIPICAAAGLLSVPVLVVVTFFGATLGVLFSSASVAVLPTIVEKRQIVEANVTLSMGDSVVTLGGPGAAGWMIQAIGAPKAIVADCLSFLSSALLLRGASGRSFRPTTNSTAPPLIADIRDGLRALIATPVMRALTLSAAVFAIGLGVQGTVLYLFFTRTLALDAGQIGIVLMVGGAGSLVGSAIAGRVGRRLGIGRSVAAGTVLEVLGSLLIPLSMFIPLPLFALAVGHMVYGVGYTIYAVNQLSLRQHIVRPGFLGRITAGRRFLSLCLAPAGAFIGAWLADHAGILPALSCSSLFFLAGSLVLWLSPVRNATIDHDGDWQI